MRLDAPVSKQSIRMDDRRRSVAELMPAAEKVVAAQGEQIAPMFLKEPALRLRGRKWHEALLVRKLGRSAVSVGSTLA